MDTEPKTILLLGATFATGNMGVGALTAGAVTVIAKRHPGARLSLLDYGKVPTVSQLDVDGTTLEIPLINLRFSWKVLLPNNVGLLLLLAAFTRLLKPGLRTSLIRRNRWLAAIDRAELALAVSGGDSFSDIYGLGRFFYVTLPQFLVILLGKRLVLLPQTIGPFNGALSKSLARQLMLHATPIYSRDAEGVNEARRILAVDEPSSRVCFCPDMGFVVEPHPPDVMGLGALDLSGTNRSRPLVGLNVSGLLLIGGYSKRNMFQLNVNYSDLVDRIVTLFVEVKNANVLLVPHVFGEHEESDAVAVRSVHRRLRNQHADRLFCIEGDYDQNEIKHVIGRCDFFVGSRMHACIAALSQTIPAVGVAYSDKFVGVFSSVGAGDLIADPRHLTMDQTLDVMARAFDGRDSIRTRLRERMPQVEVQVLKLLDEVLE